MSNKHISDFKYRDFFKEEYEDGEAGTKELLEDTKSMIRFIFKSDSDLGERVLDNIYVIAGGDAKNQLRLLNTIMIMSSSFVLEDGIKRHMSRDELEASFPIRNMAMNAIAISLEMSAKRIRKMQSTIDNLTEALSVSMKDDIDEQSNTNGAD